MINARIQLLERKLGLEAVEGQFNARLQRIDGSNVSGQFNARLQELEADEDEPVTRVLVPEQTLKYTKLLFYKAVETDMKPSDFNDGDVATAYYCVPGEETSELILTYSSEGMSWGNSDYAGVFYYDEDLNSWFALKLTTGNTMQISLIM